MAICRIWTVVYRHRDLGQPFLGFSWRPGGGWLTPTALLNVRTGFHQIWSHNKFVMAYIWVQTRRTVPFRDTEKFDQFHS